MPLDRKKSSRDISCLALSGLKRIRKAKYYGLLFDSTPDQAHREQMAEVVRFVDINFEEKTVSMKDAESLAECILNQPRNDVMDLDDCRSQCYDNVTVMAGYKTGVQKRITEKNNLAIFINCYNH
ncbi:hypothetical protein AVEN_179644-1 [Araneus ventricosus]|uniref:Uncharacterized protein n=1 Tax=Araneus ventricosus TaxID=182803 RepID=A0A4Y2BEC4_ARAVE|nr:hypothetical protein AVEN_179644-1 [Araneus ventricosus]